MVQAIASVNPIRGHHDILRVYADVASAIATTKVYAYQHGLIDHVYDTYLLPQEAEALGWNGRRARAHDHAELLYRSRIGDEYIEAYMPQDYEYKKFSFIDFIGDTSREYDETFSHVIETNKWHNDITAPWLRFAGIYLYPYSLSDSQIIFDLLPSDIRDKFSELIGKPMRIDVYKGIVLVETPDAWLFGNDRYIDPKKKYIINVNGYQRDLKYGKYVSDYIGHGRIIISSPHTSHDPPPVFQRWASSNATKPFQVGGIVKNSAPVFTMRSYHSCSASHSCHACHTSCQYCHSCTPAHNCTIHICHSSCHSCHNCHTSCHTCHTSCHTCHSCTPCLCT